MNTLRRLGLLSVPMMFILAGIGMLWLGRVESSPGSFHEQVANHATDWDTAHLILLFSAMLITPAAMTIRSLIRDPRAGGLGTAMLFLIVPTATLLAGQYAIDFVMPLIVAVGGDALLVHDLLGDSVLIGALFYQLPNLVFLAMMVLSVAMVWDGVMKSRDAALLLVNWIAVMVGNLIHPTFQRVAILMLAVSFMPLIWQQWQMALRRRGDPR